MSGVDAAATLSLKIDTSSANESLTALENRMKGLGASLNSGSAAQPKAISNIGTSASEAAAQLKTLHATVGALEAKLSASGSKTGIFGNVTKAGYEVQGLFGKLDHSVERTDTNLKTMLKSAEMAGAAAVRQAQELGRAKNLANSLELRVIAAEEAAKVKKAADDVAALGRAKNLANSLELRVIAAEEAAKVKKAADDVAALGRAKNLANSLELRVIAAEEAARIKAALKDAQELAKWLALTDKQRASATVQASKALYGGGQQSVLPGVAGSSQALSAAQSAGSVAAAEAELAKLTNAHKNLSPAIKQSADHQLHWNKIANEGHAAVRGLSGSLGTLWITYGSLVPLLAGAALGAAFKQTAVAGSEFAYQLTFVKALGNETTETVSRLSDAAKTLGQNSLQGPTELASGFRILAQAGLTGADSILAMNSVLDLAVVGEMDMAQAGTTLVGVMNAFSLSVNSASHVGDVFAKAAALSQTSVQGMTEAMKTASVVGEQYGASMEDVATALTLLAKVNITGTAAGTSLRNMLKELYAPTAGAAAAFKQLGLATSDADGKLKSFPTIIYELRTVLEKFDKASQVNILQKLFGERGAKEAVSMLSLTREKWDELNGSISQSSGFMREVASQLEGTTKGAFTQAVNALKTSFVSAFESTEGPMKAMALRLQSLFSSEEFQNGVVSAVSLIGKFASALLGAASAITTIVNIMPSGTATFVAMAAAAGGTTLAIASLASKIGSASALLSGFGVAGAAALSPLAPLYIAVGALTAAYVLFNSKTPESINSINALNFALDTQISRLKLVNAELIRKIGLESGNAGIESAAVRREISAGKSQLAEYDSVLAADAASKKSGQSTVIGDMLSNVFTTDEKKREGYAKVIEARTKRSELATKIAKAELNLKIAEGYEDEIRINSAKAQVKDLLKQQDAESKLKVGTGKFVPEARGGGGGGSKKVRDYAGDLEKSNIASLVEQQQENIKVLDLVHKNRLITEEQYQSNLAGIYAEWGPKIEDEYKNSISRLAKLQAASSGDEAKQYEKKRTDLETAYRKFQFDEAYRSADALAAEKGRIKKSGEELDKIISEQVANTQEMLDNLEASRLKLDMTPVEAAGYDAGRAARKTMNKPIADLQSQLSSAKDAGYADDSELIKSLVAEIEKAIDAQNRLGDSAAAVAKKEAEFAREYSTGWKSAYKEWADNATNAAKMASDSFAIATGAMESALDTFLTTGKVNFAEFAKSVILGIAKIEARALLAKQTEGMGGFAGIVGTILKLVGMGGSGVSGGTVAGVMVNGVAGGPLSGAGLHEGGIAGLESTFLRTVPASTFLGAPKFHQGGIAGDEVPAILKRGEGVFTQKQMRALSGKAANSSPINITVHVNGNTNAPDVRRAAGQGAREALSLMNGARRYG